MNIVISGTVGVGKTTIVEMIKKQFEEEGNNKVKIFYESVGENNPFLELYYENKAEWSFLTQINFLIDRFKNAFQEENQDELKIFDRHFLDDYIWMRLKPVKDNMFNMQVNLYNQINKVLTEKLKERNHVEYFFLLKADFEKILERIKQRNRKEEEFVDEEYWKQLYHVYYDDREVQQYLLANSENFIVIDTNNKTPFQVKKEITDILKQKTR